MRRPPFGLFYRYPHEQKAAEVSLTASETILPTHSHACVMTHSGSSVGCHTQKHTHTHTHTAVHLRHQRVNTVLWGRTLLQCSQPGTPSPLLHTTTTKTKWAPCCAAAELHRRAVTKSFDNKHNIMDGFQEYSDLDEFTFYVLMQV